MLDAADKEKYAMLRAPAFLLFASLAFLPAALPAQTPTPALPDKTTLHWFRITLVHAKAPDIIEEMHWHNPTSYGYIFNMPWGVEHVSAVGSDDALWLRATVDAYAETKGIVKVLDKGGYKFVPALTFLPVPAGDTRLKWMNSPTWGLEVSSTEERTANAFRELIKAGTETKTIRLGEWSLYDPIDLVVDTPKLRPDGLLTLDFTYGCWNGPPIEVSGIHSGDVLAVRSKQNSQITLVQVNY